MSVLKSIEDVDLRNDTPIFEKLPEEHDTSGLRNLSEEQKMNLCRLATFLWSLPKNYKGFNMASWALDENEHQVTYVDQVHECGTVACAAGHGPMVGIEPLPGENWGEYNARVFHNNNGALDRWMFGGAWSGADNTARGAAKRIFYALQHGVPKTNYRFNPRTINNGS